METITYGSLEVWIKDLGMHSLWKNGNDSVLIPKMKWKKSARISRGEYSRVWKIGVDIWIWIGFGKMETDRGLKAIWNGGIAPRFWRASGQLEFGELNGIRSTVYGRQYTVYGRRYT